MPARRASLLSFPGMSGRASLLPFPGRQRAAGSSQGFITVRQLTFSSAVRDGRGFTLVEMLIVVAIIGILASMAVAAHKYARMRGGEVAAVAALDAINKAQVSYRELCGNHRFYAPTLVSLGVPMPARARRSSARIWRRPTR